MTNKDFSAAYFEQAKDIYRELKVDYESARWHLVVRRAQEAVELILKGFLRTGGLEVTHLHDVGNILLKEKDRLQKQVVSELMRIISISRRLRQERETSFYGDEAQELPPSALYTKIDADQARGDVEWLLKLIP
jgi:HEPN domain-containing protein